MLDLSMGEIGVIAAIALVVLGPDKLPQVAKTAGSLMGKAQRFVSQVKNDIDKEVELSELKKIQEDAKKMASDLQSSLKNTTDSIEKQVSDVRDSVTSAGQEVKSTMDNASKELKDQWMESTDPKAELSMENIVDGTAKTETASASTGLGKDAAWENLDKSVDTSMLEKAFDWGASDIKPTLPQELSGPAPTVESYNFGQAPANTPMTDPNAPTLADLMREINALKQQVEAQKVASVPKTGAGRFAPRSHVNKTRISRV